MKSKKPVLFFFVLVAGVLSIIAEPASGLFFPGYQSFSDSLDFRMSVLGYGLYQDVEESGLNPYNVLGLPRWRSQLEMRPDFYMALNHLDLEFKPRFQAHYNIWGDGIFKQEDNAGEGDVYVNEWLARLRITDSVFISGGRENLQWGPSLLLSPSNSFYRDNGRNNPSLELPGLDYVRAVFIPNNVWTLSLIANVGKGRDDSFFRFHNAYAVKLDFTGEEKYFSLIGSCRESEKAEVGFFAGMNASEPLMVYGEGKASAEEESVDILAGVSYTTMNGSIFSVEYYHHGDGCNRMPIEDCVASQDFFQELLDRFDNFTGTLDELLDAVKDLEFDADRFSFIRKNYFLLQYSKPRIMDVLSLTLRFTYNIDDVSARIVGLGNYEVSNHIEIFGVGNLYPGAPDTEYGSLINYSLMAGMTLKF